MDKFKYIIVISLIALFASCAKDEEISMGSLKIDTQVTDISSTSVMIEFNMPTNAVPLSLKCIILYDENGNPVSGVGYYSDYFNDNNTISIEGGNVCIVEGLKPNTTYKYELFVYEKDNQSVNNGSDDHYWGGIILSDPSYTFTTGSQEDYSGFFTATVVTESLTTNSANLNIILNENLNIFNILDVGIYISENEDGSNPIYSYSGYSYSGLNITEEFIYLKSQTKYYVFARGYFEYNTTVNGYEHTIATFEDVSLQLNPNYFVTL